MFGDIYADIYAGRGEYSCFTNTSIVRDDVFVAKVYIAIGKQVKHPRFYLSSFHRFKKLSKVMNT